MKITQLNHVALHVADVQRSIDFYGGLLGLTQIHRPQFDFEGAWFDLGEDRSLHLIGGRDKPSNGHNRGTHTAFCVDDFDAAVALIESHGIRHHGPNLRPDGARQLFVFDPDDHVIELCDNTTADASKRTLWP
ncbi:MAG: glyoxalase [Phycisphaera sp.]|nr:glyoxalase [Phycisphaera sp.]